MSFSRIFIRTAALSALVPFAALAAPVGKITTLNGEGVLTRGETEIPLTLSLAVEPNDIIETADGANATIEFDDKSTLSLGAKAELTIDQYVYDPEASSGNVSALQVSSGFFRFVSGKMAKKKVKVRTPVSTIGIRGTEFFGEVKYNGETAVSLVHCCADVSNEAGATALDREGFYAEVTSKNDTPTRADFTPEHFYKTASTQLGVSIQELGLKELTPIKEFKTNKGPADRKTFPHIQ